MANYQTGLCSIGCHEGTNPKNHKGNPLPTCTSWQICHCKCHATYNEMYKMAEMDRVAVNNSGYVADRGSFVMPDLAELAARRSSSITGPGTGTLRIESELPDTVPATIARTFAPTPSGRAAKGELEAQVKVICDEWLVEYLTPPQQQARPCTPAWVSEEIGKKYGIKSPSVGAIDAVWKRWVEIGFAITAKKPTRFLSYTEDGVRLTLEGCKARAKRAKKVGAR